MRPSIRAGQSTGATQGERVVWDPSLNSYPECPDASSGLYRRASTTQALGGADTSIDVKVACALRYAPVKAPALLSNCLGSQAIWAAVWLRVGSHRVWSRTMILMIVSSFLIAAVSATSSPCPPRTACRRTP